jgi:hypothetical protein
MKSNVFVFFFSSQKPKRCPFQAFFFQPLSLLSVKILPIFFLFLCFLTLYHSNLKFEKRCPLVFLSLCCFLTHLIHRLWDSSKCDQWEVECYHNKIWSNCFRCLWCRICRKPINDKLPRHWQLGNTNNNMYNNRYFMI